MESKYDELFQFLSVGEKPPMYDKSQTFQLKKYASNFLIKDGELFYGNRRAIKSKEEARRIFEDYHFPLAFPFAKHPGIVKTRSAISSKFYWCGMTTDIDSWVRECNKCQVERSLPASQPSESIKVSSVWEFVGIGILGPLPLTGKQFQYILTATDYFSRWVEAFPLRTKSAAEAARHVCSMFYRHGLPKRFLSNQGQEYINEINDNICKILNVERKEIVAYYPHTYCLVNATNNNIKRTLTKCLSGIQNNWDVYLDGILFAFRAHIHTTTKHSPFLVMYGREARYPSQVPEILTISPILPDESTVKKSVMENIGKSKYKPKIVAKVPKNNKILEKQEDGEPENKKGRRENVSDIKRGRGESATKSEESKQQSDTESEQSKGESETEREESKGECETESEQSKGEIETESEQSKGESETESEESKGECETESEKIKLEIVTD